MQHKKNELLYNKKNLQLQLDTKYKEVSDARNNFIAETDGTGGTGKVGLKEIAKAKQNEYEKLNQAYLSLNSELQPAMQATDSALTAIEVAKQKRNESICCAAE